MRNPPEDFDPGQKTPALPYNPDARGAQQMQLPVATGAAELDLQLLAGALAMVVKAAAKDDVARAWREDGAR